MAPIDRNRNRKAALLCTAVILFGGLVTACGSAPSSSSQAPSSAPRPEAPPSQVSSAEPASSRAVSSEAAVSEIASVSSVSPASSAPAAAAVYANAKYGLRVALPADWKGFTVLTQTWKATDFEDPQNQKLSESGPELLIRNPKWTKAKPYQDIPVMVLTPAQWERAEREEIVFGAAPVGPRKLAANSKYVFALPARYNFAFPEGYEEVDKIIDSGAVTAAAPRS